MGDVNIREVPPAPEFVRFQEGFGQKFLLTVDTEEEFDWRAPLDRFEARRSNSSMPGEAFCSGPKYPECARPSLVRTTTQRRALLTSGRASISSTTAGTSPVSASLFTAGPPKRFEPVNSSMTNNSSSAGSRMIISFLTAASDLTADSGPASDS